MVDRAAIVEGTETCQDELTIEDGSVGNGTIDADGAQPHGAEIVSDAQGVQLVRGNASMVSGGIVGAEAQLGAAEDVGGSTFGTSSGALSGKLKKQRKRGKRAGQQPRLNGDQRQELQKQRDQAN